MDTKICSKCGKELPLSDFYKNKAQPDGHSNYCKTCQYEFLKKSRQRKVHPKVVQPKETPSGGGRTYAQGLHSQGSSKVHSERTDVGVKGKRICRRVALRGGHSKGA